jgi:hypothetical protein
MLETAPTHFTLRVRPLLPSHPQVGTMTGLYHKNVIVFEIQNVTRPLLFRLSI